MYELYYSPGACSLAIHALLRHLGVEFTLHRVALDTRENRGEAFLAVNPRGQVPVLVAGENILRESAAIALYLLEKHPSELLPKSGPGRIAALEWLAFFNSTMHQAFGAYFLMSARLEGAAKEAATSLMVRRIAHLWKEVEAHLATSNYLCGDSITVPDIFMAVIANWTTTLTPSIHPGGNVARACLDVVKQPYFTEALAAEKFIYRLA